MPTYQFTCKDCHATTKARRTFATCSEPLACICGGTSLRVFSASFGIIGDPVAYQDANRYAYGRDDTERRANMKAEDVRYEASWEGKSIDKPKPKPTLKEMYHEMHGPLN